MRDSRGIAVAHQAFNNSQRVSKCRLGASTFVSEVLCFGSLGCGGAGTLAGTFGCGAAHEH
eukprot:8142701-Alexandrium_andersonii.AAC.2